MYYFVVDRFAGKGQVLKCVEKVNKMYVCMRRRAALVILSISYHSTFAPFLLEREKKNIK